MKRLFSLRKPKIGNLKQWIHTFFGMIHTQHVNRAKEMQKENHNRVSNQQYRTTPEEYKKKR